MCLVECFNLFSAKGGVVWGFASFNSASGFSLKFDRLQRSRIGPRTFALGGFEGVFNQIRSA